MTRLAACTLLLIAFACVTQAQVDPAPATQPAASQPAVAAKPTGLAPPTRSRDRYDVLVQRNIFVRHEGSGTPRNRSEGPATRPARTESWLLTGTAIADDRRVAFVENTTTGAAKRVRVGDSVDGRRVSNIDANGVDVEAAGATRRVALGASFDGSAAPTTMPSTSFPDGSAGSAAGSGGASASESSILERMRARRNQEMNK